jgi:hypothetical protein
MIIVGEVALSSTWFCPVRMSRLVRKMRWSQYRDRVGAFRSANLASEEAQAAGSHRQSPHLPQR